MDTKKAKKPDMKVDIASAPKVKPKKILKKQNGKTLTAVMTKVTKTATKPA